MDKNEQSMDEAMIDTLLGNDYDSRAQMTQAELLAELLSNNQEKTDDPLGEF